MFKPTRFSDTAMVNRRAVLAGLGVCLAGSAMLFGGKPVHAAESLDGPRSAGIVGERYDGYAVPRDGAGADVQNLIADINNKRRAFYQQKAGEQGVDITAIQEIYAKAIYDKAPSGWWFQTRDGWVQK